MQSKIENRSEYESKIKGNPIKMLKAIKQHALSFQETKWSILTVIDAIKAFINMKQKDGEQLIDYLKRFKTARDVFISHLGGPLILSKLASQHKDYTMMDSLKKEVLAATVCSKLDRNKEIEEEVFKSFLSGLYLDNCDKLKYGEFNSYLASQYGLKRDQYP